jgi:2-polyprenyl-3-methyl-5-hydroxy-6-metoxy-1,4-benzoquinol methylase
MCPNCCSDKATTVDQKYLVTKLMRCANCRLLFRVPITTDTENERFYNLKYEQGFTTDMPSDQELAVMLKTNFAGNDRDYGVYVNVLESLALPAGAQIFDFGCSWGYGSYQLTQAGYEVTAYEVSNTRLNFARNKLSITVVDAFDACLEDHNYLGRFDCFFSSHVLEHVPSPSAIFRAAWKLLKPGGIFVAFAPNGSVDFRAENFALWHKLWGEVHPNFLDDEFYKCNFENSPAILSSAVYDYDAIAKASFDAPGIRAIGNLAGQELFFAARKSDHAISW